jgi:hypothetical protein
MHRTECSEARGGLCDGKGPTSQHSESKGIRSMRQVVGNKSLLTKIRAETSPECSGSHCRAEVEAHFSQTGGC